MKRRSLIILIVLVAIALILPTAYYFFYLERPVKAATTDLDLTSNDLTTFNLKSTENEDQAPAIYSGIVGEGK